MNWGEAYKQGFERCLGIFFKEESPQYAETLERLYKEPDGSPTQYAVAFKCCGGVDAHEPGCHRG